MTGSLYRKSILLSGFSFLLVNGLPAYSETDDQIPAQAPYDNKEPWRMDQKRLPPPDIFFPTPPKRHLDSTIIDDKHHVSPFDTEEQHSFVPLMPAVTNSKFADISTREIKAKDIDPTESFPPFPATIDLPVTLEIKSPRPIYVSGYIPGDTKSGHNENAVPTSTKVKDSPILHNNTGVKLGSEGKWAEAIEEHKTALAAQPMNRQFMTNLSSAELKYAEEFEHNGNLSEAIKHYRDALYTDKLNASADKSLDSCLKRKGIDTTDPIKCKKLADKLIKDGDLEGAIVEYNKLIRLTDAGRVHADFGFLLLKANKAVDGYIELTKAVGKTDWSSTETKELAKCHRQLAEILQNYSQIAMDSGRRSIGMKRLLNAWIEYKRTLFLEPKDKESIKQLASLSAEAVKIKPSFNNCLALGSASLLNKDLDKAAESYSMCSKLEPANSSLPKALTALKTAEKKAHIQK